MYSQPYPPYSAYSTTPSSLEVIPPVSPVYVILLLGMVGFMLANFVPSMVEGGAEKVGWVKSTISPRGPADAKQHRPDGGSMGFRHHPSDPLYESSARDAQLTDKTGATMTGLLPGVPRLHITYVHLAVAFFLYAA